MAALSQEYWHVKFNIPWGTVPGDSPLIGNFNVGEDMYLHPGDTQARGNDVPQVEPTTLSKVVALFQGQSHTSDQAESAVPSMVTALFKGRKPSCLPVPTICPLLMLPTSTPAAVTPPGETPPPAPNSCEHNDLPIGPGWFCPQLEECHGFGWTWYRFEDAHLDRVWVVIRGRSLGLFPSWYVFPPLGHCYI